MRCVRVRMMPARSEEEGGHNFPTFYRPHGSSVLLSVLACVFCLSAWLAFSSQSRSTFSVRFGSIKVSRDGPSFPSSSHAHFACFAPACMKSFPTKCRRASSNYAANGRCRSSCRQSNVAPPWLGSYGNICFFSSSSYGYALVAATFFYDGGRLMNAMG